MDRQYRGSPPRHRPHHGERDGGELRVILLILTAAIALGVAILPTHRADLHAMHAANCDECS